MKLGALLSDTAARRPAHIACVCGPHERTFAGLDQKATHVANALRSLDVKPGDRVALYLPNCMAAIELMCGCARAGAVVVPIPSRLTIAEADYIISDSEPRVLFTADANVHVTGGHLVKFVLDVEREADALADFLAQPDDTPFPPLPQQPDDIVLGYTSGTTGNPKGAVGTHSTIILNSGMITATEYGLHADDRMLVTSPIAHRVGLSRIVNMICTGLTTVVMQRFDAAAAIDLIERYQITGISVVPTIARLLAPEFAKDAERCRSLEYLYATGEAFPVPLKTEIAATLPWLKLHTSYAQTEAGFVCNLRPHEQTLKPESVGRAVPGVEVRIVDEQCRDVALGEAGEILVRGGTPGSGTTMREYFRRPDETREAFVDGWLRTGDMGRADADGYFYFVDRLKDMVVSGGLNIYAKEVELAIVSHTGVADAAVVGVPDHEYGEAVLAFVECERGATLSAADIIAHCRALLASYKKPRHIIFVERMPRTASGKVRKPELRALYAQELEQL